MKLKFWGNLFLISSLLLLFNQPVIAAKKATTYVAPYAGKIENYQYQGKKYRIPAAYIQQKGQKMAALAVTNDHRGHVILVSYIGDATATKKYFAFKGTVRYFASLYNEKDFIARYLEGQASSTKQDYLAALTYAATHTVPVINKNKHSTQFQTVPQLYQLEDVNATSSNKLIRAKLKMYTKKEQMDLGQSVLATPEVTMLNQQGERGAVSYQAGDVSQINVDPLAFLRS
ncbi:hypothetical protein [Loigolactobacillus backii]|uniref:Uncharacterized protein n=1 Tax=Loigolactobacillus backii TaxID=375175 RepID=A0A192H1J6_9LACO|nr:hypothetical protein [Loigolactobacillus backii]ANK62235.1 hypothetical protein AYR53_05275 [Loigolactobacillus backii]ANK70750.1 hypothetical protein AYR56_11710 [Loigolactobacillus backii]MDA5387645.1 hypothetical protein [Loigolactobacillus backii]MDA5390198.1 hypothetical protein [Loigolactobacillus backii]PIO82665.1 hypothetical protein BSQ39_03300 [Loigolactobacillus backii]